MDNMLLYLLKVTAGTTLFYLTYLVFFRKETFYLRNRIFLILTLILPAVFPLLKIPVAVTSSMPSEPVNEIINLIPADDVTGIVQTAAAGTTSFNINELVGWIYLIGAGLIILRGLISLISTFRIIRKGTKRSNQFPKVVISDIQNPPFSFFPYAVIPSKEYETGEYDDILDHEFAHIRQGHTFDLLLSEFFIAFQWFNPFVWLIKRSVILNHEYLADHVSIINRSVKEYQYRLLNFNKELKNISLAHTFNSLIKNRIIMINKKPTHKYAAWKNILVLPAILAAVYAFATPEYHIVAPTDEPLIINQPPIILQKEVRGIVVNKEGKPLKGVNISSTGTLGSIISVNSDNDGRFVLIDVKDDSFLVLRYRGYTDVISKPDFKKEMSIIMSMDNSYKVTEYANEPGEGAQKPITFLDGLISDQPTSVLIEKLGNEFGTVVVLKGKEATDKYGEAGKNGVEEVYSRDKATELGLKFPFRRVSPDEYPTFQGKGFITFNDWVISQIKYPAEATSNRIKGRVTASYTIEADGSVTNVKIMGKSDPLLADAVMKAVQSSPKWEPAIKEVARVPFAQMVSLKFELPDRISPDDVYVMVEKMPLYPGGDVELLKFIATNTKYPEAAKAEKIEGRVIVRLIVNNKGNAEEVTILRGVHPLLDDEAIRVVSMLSGFEPGMHDGKPVNVWYMVPITFVLPKVTVDSVRQKIRTRI
ncbi:MAG TPA: M56 family metallopeptidase [Bacteroidales bacterium]|nr:M56 family metallopeptidase [Bacteroidales bacterium]